MDEQPLRQFPQQDAPMLLLCPHCQAPALQPDLVNVNQHMGGENSLLIFLKTMEVAQVPDNPGVVPGLMILFDCRSCHDRSALTVTTDPERGSTISLQGSVSADEPDEGDEEDERP